MWEEFQVSADPPVGAGLPAKAARQSLHVLLQYRFRRQASSHIWYLLI